MGKLHVGSADYSDLLNNPECHILKLFLKLFIYSKEWCRAEGVSCMDTHCINVLDEADGNHLVLGVPDHLHLQLFPAEDRLLDKALVCQGKLKAVPCDSLKFLHVVAETATLAAHGICRTHYYRETDVVCYSLSFGNCMADSGAGGLDSKPLHGFLEDLPVLAPLNSVQVYADNFYAIFVQNSSLAELAGQVQAGLAA